MPAPVRDGADIRLTHDASGSSVEQGFLLAEDENGYLQWSPGLAASASPTQRTDVFSYEHRDPRIDLPAAFEDWRYGAGFEDAPDVGTLGFPGYHFTQGVDLSWGRRGYLSPQKQTGGSTVDAPLKFVESSLGLFAMTSRYVYENVSGTWTERLDAGSGVTLTDLIEYSNSTSTYLIAGIKAGAYYYSVDGIVWVRITTPGSVAFRSQSSNTANAASTVTVTAPVSIADDDILIASCTISNDEIITPPAGFTQIASIGNAVGSAFRFMAWWKRAASESGNYAFNWTTSSEGAAQVSAYSGAVTSGNPIEASSANSGTGTTVTFSTITTNEINRMAVTLMGGRTYASVAPPGGFTERVDAVYSTSTGIHVSDDEQTAAGASGGKTATLSGGSNQTWGAALIAVIPAEDASQQDVRRFFTRGSTGGEPLLWAISATGDIRNTSDPATASAWSSADATQVGQAQAEIVGGGVINNVFYIVNSDGITSYDGTTVKTLWAPVTLTLGSSDARPTVGPDNLLYFTFSGVLMRLDPNDGGVSKIWPRGPQVGSPELNGTITAINFDEGNGYFALKNAAGNTYVLKFDPSLTVEADGTTIWPVHTWYYNGASDCLALLVVSGSSDTFSSTNPQLVIGDGTTADYLILPKKGYRPEDDSACRFEATSDRIVYGSYVTFRAQSFLKWLTAGDIEGADLDSDDTIALQYQVPGGSATTIATANSNGRTTADVSAEVQFSTVRPVLLLNNGAATTSPVLKGVVLHAAPNPPRDRMWNFTVRIGDGMERRGGGKWEWPSVSQEPFLLDARNERCTLKDLLGNTYTVRVLDVVAAGATFDAHGNIRQNFMVSAVAL